jgi:hypothetical protein
MTSGTDICTSTIISRFISTIFVTPADHFQRFQIMARSVSAEKEALDTSALQRKVTMLEKEVADKEAQITKVSRGLRTFCEPATWPGFSRTS